MRMFGFCTNTKLLTVIHQWVQYSVMKYKVKDENQNECSKKD